MSIQPSPVGVFYTIATQSSPSLQSNAPARAQFVGLTTKGPLNYPGVISTVSQFESIFGGPSSFDTLYHPVRAYIEEQGGAGECYITRVVGPNATNGSVTLQTGAEVPVDTLTVEVTDPGEHTTSYQAVVTASTSGTTVAVIDSTTGRVLGTFGPAETVEEIVELALGHRDVTVRSLGEAGLPAPGTYPLSGGSDDRLSITAQTHVDALNAHKAVPNGVGVALPGQPGTAELADGVLAHCGARKKEYFTAPRQNATIAEANALGDLLVGAGGYKHHGGVFYPHVRVPDVGGGSKTRVISPEAYILACRAITHRRKSPAAAPVGQARAARWVKSTLTVLDEADVNTLNGHHVNGIVTEGGRTYPYNYVTLSTDPALFNLNDTAAVNALTSSIDSRLRGDEILFEPNGQPELLARIEGHVVTALAPYERYLQPRFDVDGGTIDPGYVIRVENVNDSGQDAPYDKLHIEVDVRLRPTLRSIDMTVRRLEFLYDRATAAAAA